MKQQSGLGDRVRRSIVSTVQGTGEVVNAVTDTVTGSVASALRGVGNVGQVQKRWAARQWTRSARRSRTW